MKVHLESTLWYRTVLILDYVSLSAVGTAQRDFGSQRLQFRQRIAGILYGVGRGLLYLVCVFLYVGII
jgi:hypothetical protein